MKTIQVKLYSFYNKRPVFKTIILLILILFCWFDLNAQKENNLKLKIETGLLWDWVSKNDWNAGGIYLSGPFINLEPKLRTSKNTFIGLRLGAAFNTQRIINSDPNRFEIFNYYENGGNNRVLSFVPTFDYYFTRNKLRSYLGLGIGYNFLTTSKTAAFLGSRNLFDLSINNTYGVLLRGGFALHKLVIRGHDLSKFTIGLEFNYIPKSNVEISSGQVVGTVLTSNIALSIGYNLNLRKISRN